MATSPHIVRMATGLACLFQLAACGSEADPALGGEDRPIVGGTQGLGGAILWATPNGTLGGTCEKAAPCSLQSAVDQANGDPSQPQRVFVDGVFPNVAIALRGHVSLEGVPRNDALGRRVQSELQGVPGNPVVTLQAHASSSTRGAELRNLTITGGHPGVLFGAINPELPSAGTASTNLGTVVGCEIRDNYGVMPNGLQDVQVIVEASEPSMVFDVTFAFNTVGKTPEAPVGQIATPRGIGFGVIGDGSGAQIYSRILANKFRGLYVGVGFGDQSLIFNEAHVLSNTFTMNQVGVQVQNGIAYVSHNTFAAPMLQFAGNTAAGVFTESPAAATLMQGNLFAYANTPYAPNDSGGQGFPGFQGHPINNPCDIHTDGTEQVLDTNSLSSPTVCSPGGRVSLAGNTIHPNPKFQRDIFEPSFWVHAPVFDLRLDPTSPRNQDPANMGTGLIDGGELWTDPACGTTPRCGAYLASSPTNRSAHAVDINGASRIVNMGEARPDIGASEYAPSQFLMYAVDRNTQERTRLGPNVSLRTDEDLLIQLYCPQWDHPSCQAIEEEGMSTALKAVGASPGVNMLSTVFYEAEPVGSYIIGPSEIVTHSVAPSPPGLGVITFAASSLLSGDRLYMGASTRDGDHWSNTNVFDFHVY